MGSKGGFGTGCSRRFTALGNVSLTGESNVVLQCKLEKEMDAEEG